MREFVHGGAARPLHHVALGQAARIRLVREAQEVFRQLDLVNVMAMTWEARILQRCMTPEATDSTYARRCVPRKARLDLIYQQRQSMWLDLAILLATFGRPTRTRRDPQSCINQTRALLDERGGNRPRRFAEGGEP